MQLQRHTLHIAKDTSQMEAGCRQCPLELLTVKPGEKRAVQCGAVQCAHGDTSSPSFSWSIKCK